MKRGIFFVVLLIAVFGPARIIEGSAQSYTNCPYDECALAIEMHPGFLIIAGTAYLICRFGRKEVAPLRIENTVGIWTRLGAFCIDLLIVSVFFYPVFALGVLWIEAYWTGEFAWSFSRDFARPTDWVPDAGTLLVFAIMFTYFRMLPRMHKPTIGQYVMGYMIVPINSSQGKIRSGYRAVCGLFALAFWPFTLYHAAKSPDRVFWWDKDSKTRAVRTKYI
ncbi:MAG: hypothetical protein Hens3KO_21960 [Henriciella sp.]